MAPHISSLEIISFFVIGVPLRRGKIYKYASRLVYSVMSYKTSIS